MYVVGPEGCMLSDRWYDIAGAGEIYNVGARLLLWYVGAGFNPAPTPTPKIDV